MIVGDRKKNVGDRVSLDFSDCLVNVQPEKYSVKKGEGVGKLLYTSRLYE